MNEIITENNNRGLMIGDKAPRFAATSTAGNIKLSDYVGNWLVLFSHPR